MARVPDLLFPLAPQDKLGKNRLHVDLRPQDQDAEVSRLEVQGARRLDVGQGTDVSWVVMADPDGNEFCVLRPLSPERPPTWTRRSPTSTSAPRRWSDAGHPLVTALRATGLPGGRSLSGDCLDLQEPLLVEDARQDNGQGRAMFAEDLAPYSAVHLRVGAVR